MVINTTDRVPDYDVLLVDANGTEVGLVIPGDGEVARSPVETSSLKTTTGNQKYSDLQPPYMTLAQSDWTGGRGSPEYEDDVTRFKDSLRADTERDGGVITTGLVKLCGNDPLRSITPNQHFSGSVEFKTLTNADRHMAVVFTTNDSYDTDLVYLWLRYVGTPGDLTVAIWSVSGGEPNAELVSDTISYTDLDQALVSEYVKVTMTTAQTMSASTSYALVIYSDETDNTVNYWQIGTDPDASDASGTTYSSANAGTTWSADAWDIYYRVLAEIDQSEWSKFFRYKSSLYLAFNRGSDGAPRLRRNGRRGTCTSNSGDLTKTNVQGTEGFDSNDIGTIIRLVSGTGAEQQPNWRVITAVDDTNTVTMDSPWDLAHDTTTDWVQDGSDLWYSINDVNSVLLKPLTDVFVSSTNVVYFMMGNEQTQERYREYNNSGTWTVQLATDTGTVHRMAEYNDAGTLKLICQNGYAQVKEATVQSWGTSLTLGSGINVGQPADARIRGMVKYLDSALDEIVVIFTENGPYQLKASTVSDMKVEEMDTLFGAYNGSVFCRQGSYLFFNMQKSLYRYYNPTFDDVGINRDEGLDEDKRGVISGLVSYPGRIIASVNGGLIGGYSSIFIGSGSGDWSEKYRAPKGDNINNIAFQVVPSDDYPNKLWFFEGVDPKYIEFPSSVYDPLQDTNMEYSHEFVLELGAMTAGLYEAYKYWKDLKIRAERLSAGTVWLEADYKLDSDTTWTTFSDTFETSPVETKNFGSTYGVSSQVLKIRIRGYTIDKTTTPRLKSVAVSGVTIVPPKYAYTCRAQALYEDKNGKRNATAPSAQIAQLDTWCGTAEPLKLYTPNPLHNGKDVFIQPIPASPGDTAQKIGDWEYEVSLVLQEA